MNSSESPEGDHRLLVTQWKVNFQKTKSQKTEEGKGVEIEWKDENGGIKKTVTRKHAKGISKGYINGMGKF